VECDERGVKCDEREWSVTREGVECDERGEGGCEGVRKVTLSTF
jgi:hypothetical protein